MAASTGRSGVVCAGAWCVDRNKILDRWPVEETVATVLSESNQGGCPGHNMATALKRLGAMFPIEAVGLIGNDEDGRMLQAICDEHGIDRRQLTVHPSAATAYSEVMIDQRNGKRTFFYGPGAHALISPDHFDFSRTSARFVHLGLPGLHAVLDAPWKDDASGWVAVLKAARAAGLQTNIELVSIEPERIRAAAEPMLPHLDTFIVNDWEVGAVTGLQTVRDGKTDIAACREAAELVLDRSGIWLVAVHFPDGGIIRTRDGRSLEHPSVAVPPEAIVSSNGAGDSFAAGILFGIHEDWPLERALKLAHAAAAASLRSPETTGSVVPWRKCLELADRWGWRRLPEG